jgi:hypothetical protein
MGPRTMQGDVPPAEGVEEWFAGRLPDDWFEGAPEVAVAREEVTVVGTLAAPSGGGEEGASGPQWEAGRISRFREQTREERMRIAREAERRFGRKVAWGAQAGSTREVFANLAVPVMTRLRQPERRVLDTLVDSGVARSRSEALAWCVRLVGRHTGDWLAELRTAMESVERVRRTGPAA